MERDYEVDLLGLFRQMLKRWFVILLATVLCAAVGFAYAKVTFKYGEYSACASVAVMQKSFEREKIDTSAFDDMNIPEEIQMAGRIEVLQREQDAIQRQQDATYLQILANAQQLLISDSALQGAIDELNLSESIKEVRSRVHIAREETKDSRMSVFKITASGPDQEQAIQLRDVLCKNAVDNLAGEQGQNLIRVQTLSQTDSDDGMNMKIPAAAALMGFICMAGIVFLQTLVDNRIHQRRDVTQGLELPVLAVIPQISHKS